jgi:hypothetical protein
MQLYKEVAESLGLSNVQLAGFLGISNSLLHMSLKGERNLPSRSFATLVDMQQKLQKTETLLVAGIAGVHQMDEKKLNRFKNRLIHRHLIAQRRLKNLETRHRKLQNLIVWVQLQLSNPAELSTKQRLWLEMHEANARKKLRNCSQTDLLLAEVQLEGIAAQVRMLDAWFEAKSQT